MELDSGQKHFLRLAQAEGGKAPDGWAKVSAAVWPLMESLPSDLIELKPSNDGGFARITDQGSAILMYS